ncbi:MAG: AgmX/PglI C-terminal domain-containing protein [Myxococcota bacterium]
MATAAKGAAARKTGSKVLRVGIIQNGRPVEERLFRKRQPVSIGQTPKQTFCVPVADIPKSFTLFELKGNDYYLNFTPKMGGRISLGDGVHDMGSLRKSGKAKKSGDHHQVKLNDKSRGKVVLGEVTVLFQFVVPPPPKPKPQLPASMRGGFIRGIDWNFAIILMISAIVQGGAVFWVENTDWPEPRDVGAIPDRFVQVLVPEVKEEEKEEPEEEQQKDENAEGEPEKVAEKPKPKPKPKPRAAKVVDPDRKAAKLAERKRALAKTVENKTILRTIGTMGGEGAPSLVDSLTGGADRKSLENAFAGSTGVSTASSDVERSGLRRAASAKANGVGSKTGIGDLGVKGAAKANAGVDTGGKREGPKVKAKVSLRGATAVVGSGIVDRNAVSAVINRRRGALVSCYERELKKNPNLKGKITVRFTIGTAGRVTSSSVASSSLSSSAVGSCVASRIRGWRFPKPEGGSVSVSKSFVFAPGN